ncbi:lipase/acylhydrolase with GDSL-like motif [Agrilactobacillus composti DSM 18527 = JCM 14202]|uniref:GDSL-type esterase/lipase family protein n=1 Tax=Agrilactobacillus composti TaxID=398555 RepID=UPI00042DFC7B|nr:GDSL-type esterase/lipase family protein [Agrilactobacillus composti]GAF39145.1 lipase/acylhydrolase with GDSL-like motif [Agrilactobacillus composti DSM 18527 = JCM 14202]
MKKYWLLGMLLSLFCIGGLFVAVTEVQPNVALAAKKTTKSVRPVAKKQLQITAIGDSLTQGVGDSAKDQGYVGLLKKTITKKYPKTKVTTANFGVGGNTSAQILDRVLNDPKITASVQKADAVVMTMGGNDIMQVISKDPLHVTTQAVDTKAQAACKNLTQIIQKIRTVNSQVPIFVIGLYNPFYVLMPTVTTMQAAVHSWNAGTQAALKLQNRSYFVPVDAILTKGDAKTKKAVAKRLKSVATTKQAQAASNSSSKKEPELTNPYLYKKDHFHPNHVGYEKMTTELYQVMADHKKLWLYQKK